MGVLETAPLLVAEGSALEDNRAMNDKSKFILTVAAFQFVVTMIVITIVNKVIHLDDNAFNLTVLVVALNMFMANFALRFWKNHNQGK